MSKKLLLVLVMVSSIMLSGCFIKGRVVDENGAGVAGVTMTLSDDDNLDKARIHMTTTTDSAGYYRFGSWDNMLLVGLYTVAPSRSGYIFNLASREVTIEGLGEKRDIPSAIDGVDFVVKTEDPPNNSVPNPPDNYRPWAKSISVTTKMNNSVQIALEGTDADGDDLTYRIVSGPSDGSLSGYGSSRTYTPYSRFFGSDSFTYTVNDGTADSTPATVSITVTPIKWVLVGEPVLNRANAPLEYYGGGSTPYYYTDARYEGKFEIYYVNETSISKDQREVDHGYEYFNTNINSYFDAPPQELIPGETHELTVDFTHGGSVTDYAPSAIFEYRADRSGIIQPFEAFTYAPWSQYFTGENSKTWTLTVPQGKPGDTFEICAFWWNCPVCDVTWTYQAQ